MTQLQSAYPKKFYNQFYSTNFIPFHLRNNPVCNLNHEWYKFCLVKTLFYRQISMAMPKANNDHFSAKNTKFSSKEFIHLNSCETHGLNQMMTISAKNTKFSRQEFIRPYSREICRLDQNCTNFVYFQVSGMHSRAPTDEKSSAN